MRTLMWFTIGFVLAIGAGFWLMVPWLWLLGIFFLLVFVAMLVFRQVNFLRLVRPIALGLGLGLVWFSVYSAIVYPPDLQEVKTLDASVQFSDYSQHYGYRTYTDGRFYYEGRMHSVRVYHGDGDSFCPGDTLTGTFLIQNAMTDSDTYPKSNGIFYILYPTEAVQITPAQKTSLLDLPVIWRHSLLQRIDAVFDEETAAFCKALLLGDRSGLPESVNNAMRISGIAHIVAVSGLHVSILFGLLDLLTLRRRKVAALIGIPALLFFAAMVGFTPSVTRACIMEICLLLSALIQRDYDRPTALSASCLIMLIVQPATLLSVSFQMSVGCIVGMELFAKPIYHWLLSEEILDASRGNRLARLCKHGFAASVSTSLSTCVATVPLVAYYFGTVSLLGIVTNLLVLWVVSIVFYGVLLALILSALLPAITAVVAFVVRIPVCYILGISGFVSRIPLAAVYTQSPYIVIWLIGVYGMLMVFLLLKRKPVSLMFACALASLCVALGLSWGIPHSAQAGITMLDVGQGQCLIVKSQNKTFLVDCGGKGSYTGTLAADTLKSRGIFHLDGILLTHFDADHCEGLPTLLAQIDADFILLPYMKDPKDMGYRLESMTEGTVLYAREDMTISFDSGEMRIFAPETYFSGNESSLSILFRQENCDILITGDREIEGEQCLLDRFSFPKIDILIAGHHGAQNATSPALLQATQPQIVLISCGERNVYGHPSEALLQRLEAYGCKVYSTESSGTLDFWR